MSDESLHSVSITKNRFEMTDEGKPVFNSRTKQKYDTKGVKEEVKWVLMSDGIEPSTTEYA